MKRLIVLCCVSLALLLPQAAPACTTFIVTKGASADGSVMVSHSDDNDLNDQSIVYVPARDWPEGAQRPVYDSAVAVKENPATNTFGGVYTWQDQQALDAYLKSEFLRNIMAHPNLDGHSSADFDIMEAPSRLTRGLAAVAV